MDITFGTETQCFNRFTVKWKISASLTWYIKKKKKKKKKKLSVVKFEACVSQWNICSFFRYKIKIIQIGKCFYFLNKSIIINMSDGTFSMLWRICYWPNKLNQFREMEMKYTVCKFRDETVCGVVLLRKTELYTQCNARIRAICILIDGI